MSIHEHLPPEIRKDLKDIGWTKGRELAKLARAEGQRFVCALWVHKARSMSTETFRREVEKELTGREEEASELILFKVYKGQVPVIERAIETAALMMGSDKSRGYCLEMICADFSRRSAPGQWRSGDPAQFCLTLLQILARRAAADLPRKPAREGVLKSDSPRGRSLATGPHLVRKSTPADPAS